MSSSNQNLNTHELYNALVDGCPEEHQLAILGAQIQSNVSRDSSSMTKYGVGELFLGIQISEQGVSWQGDTLMVIYDQEGILNSGKSGMESFIGNSIITYWGFYKDIMALRAQTQGAFLIMDDYTLSTFTKEKEGELLNNLKSKFEYAIFICADQALLTTLIINPQLNKSKYLYSAVTHSDNKMEFQIEQELMKLLMRKVTFKVEEGLYPSHLEVIFDSEI